MLTETPLFFSGTTAFDKTEESEQTAKNRRRAQVRKAQIQHRARKANYTKQLEADIAGIQAQIEFEERARRALRSENHAMRTRLAGDYSHQTTTHQQQQQQQPQFTTAGGYYTGPTPTSHPQELHQQNYGFDVGHGAAGLEGYYGGLGADLAGFLAAPGAYYDENGSSAYAGSSGDSSGGGMYRSPQYLDSRSHTPYPGYMQGMGSQAQSHQVINYMAGFS